MGPARPGPPADAGNDVDTLPGRREHRWATFAWKCGGTRATVGVSAITLGGLRRILIEEHTADLVRAPVDGPDAEDSPG